MLPSQHVLNNQNSNILRNENESPIQKGAKYSTLHKSVHNKPSLIDIPSIVTQPPCDYDKMEFKLETFENVTSYKELGEAFRKLFPAAKDNLRRSGQYDEWLLFTSLLIDGKFPTDNIAYKLFLGVLHFYNTQNVRATSYDEKNNEILSTWIPLV